MNKIILMSALLVSACSETVVTPPAPAANIAPDPVVEMKPVNINEPALVTSLMGLSPSEVIMRMGPPNLVRRDGLGQVMLFEHAACVFDIVLYAKTIETPYIVTYISSRTPLGQNTDKQQCLNIIKPDGFDNLITPKE